MVYDNINNIENYKGLSEDIYEGLKFLQQALPDIENGVHVINPRVKAIVSEYETKDVNENGYEKLIRSSLIFSICLRAERRTVVCLLKN